MSIGQLLHTLKISLRKSRRNGEIDGIAEENPTPERPRFSRLTAPALVLPGAKRSLIERSNWRGRVSQKQFRFGGGQKKRVVVLGEPAAAATQLADWRERGDFGVKLRVER